MYLKINKTKERNIFFISDPHWCHKNVIEYDNRPFRTESGEPDIELMNKSLIDNWNSVVSKEDIVFLLGDVVFGGVQKTTDILNQLNGEIHLIMGNHDSYKILSKTGRFKTISDKMNLYVKYDDSKKGQLFILDHFANLIWDKHHNGSIHLHGHSHGSLMRSPIDYIRDEYYKRKVMDVGCVNIDYTPISFDEIMDIMDNKVIDTIDHH